MSLLRSRPGEFGRELVVNDLPSTKIENFCCDSALSCITLVCLHHMKEVGLFANYGTLAGLLASTVFVLMCLAGINPFEGGSIAISVIPVAFIYQGTRRARERESQEFPYGKAFKAGLYIAFFYASLYAVLIYIYLHFYGDAIVEETKNSTLDKLELLEGKLGSSMYEKAVDGVEKISAGNLALGRYWNNLIWGVIVSLVTSALLRKKTDPFGNIEQES